MQTIKVMINTTGDDFASGVSETSRGCVALGDTTLLRGMKKSKLLARCGRLLESSMGTPETYEFSSVATHIDTFISHNWVVARGLKYKGLVTYFNAVPAIVASMLTSFACAVLVVFELLPLLPGPNGSQCSVYSLVVGGITFYFILWFGADWISFGGGTKVFLDKTCIHQTDPELKKTGIGKLGAFIFYSRRMLVLYTDVYLKKLWTVYELASFLILHPGGELNLIPLFMPDVLLYGSGMMYVAILSWQLLVVLGIEIQNRFLPISFVVFPFCFGWGVVARRWARRQAHMYDSIASFTIDDTAVFDESDRVLVERNIAALLQDIGAIPEGASKEDAMIAFNSLVRSQVPLTLKRCLGAVGFQYTYIFAACLSFWHHGVDFVATLISVGHCPPWMCFARFHGAHSAVVVGPLALAFVAIASQSCLELTGLMDVLYTLLVSMCLYLVWVAYGVCRDSLVTMASLSAVESHAAAVILYSVWWAAGILLGVFTWRIYKQESPIFYQRQTNVAMSGIVDLADDFEYLRAVHSGHSSKKS